MKFSLEQCKNILELLNKNLIDEETKNNIAILLLKMIGDIECSNCKYYDLIPSFTYCLENKCNITKEICPDCNLQKGRIQNCPYKKYEDECSEILKLNQKTKKLMKD